MAKKNRKIFRPLKRMADSLMRIDLFGENVTFQIEGEN